MDDLPRRDGPRRRSSSWRSGRRRPAATAGSPPRYDSAARNEILDTEGVVRRGAVPRRRRARHRPDRVVAVRHRARRRRPTDDPAEAVAGSRAHNRWLADFVRRGAAPPHRHRGDPGDHPRHGHWCSQLVREAKELGHRGHPHPDPLVRPARVPRPPLRPAVDAHRGARARAPHPLRRRTDRLRHGPGHAPDLRVRGRLVGGPPAARADLGRRLRAAPEPQVLDGRERRVVGARRDPQDGREVGRRPQHPQVRRRVPRRRCR